MKKLKVRTLNPYDFPNKPDYDEVQTVLVTVKKYPLLRFLPKWAKWYEIKRTQSKAEELKQ